MRKEQLMETSSKNRQIIAYHGCHKDVRDKILSGKGHLKRSNNMWDWLGSGIYFWENGAHRAEEWAKEQHGEDGVVLGAVINLGNCFDLLDTKYPNYLSYAYNLFVEQKIVANEKMPKNSSNNMRRDLDCAVINFLLSYLANHEEHSKENTFQTVRSLFTEGDVVYPGSAIVNKSHIQIAVRDESCILGYFMPR